VFFEKAVDSQEHSSIQTHVIMDEGILNKPENITIFSLVLNNRMVTLPEC
jgi:hypothetical protein